MLTRSPTSPRSEGWSARAFTQNTPLPVTSRCTRCNTGEGENARNLVVCIDGTSNQFGQNNTNVMKLFDMVNLETIHPKQYAYYSSGIGTRPKSSNILGHMKEAVSDVFDMAVAWNIDKNIKDAYGWLAGKYQEGDQIYLFGFSRGAYQVRVLAGMIQEVGLMRTPTEKQIVTAYNHYQAIRPGKPEARQTARKFKKTFSWKDVTVHFIGVWDTVSSVGLTRGDVSPSMASSACHIRHALALDERRVKFMPEYFHETNAGMYDGRSKYVGTSLDVEHAASPSHERCESATSESGASSFRRSKTTDVREVWFAGCHSDVGGKDVTGKFHQVGNVSLLWMRREAIAHGLVLQPTDVVWMPDDLDLGVSNSMSLAWQAVEYLSIKHQVGGGSDAKCMHRLEPRHVMPGQKVHASVLYANAYKPLATLGEGLEIPTTHGELEDTGLDSSFWEMGMFDDTAAQELVNHLVERQGVASIYLDRLLFMLRFKEGRECVRKVPGWHDKFEKLINSRTNAPLVRLVTIVAYYEASCDPEACPNGPALPCIEPPQVAFDDAKKYLRTTLAAHKHRDGPRVVALLRHLTRHSILRERILSQDILETLGNLLDAIVGHPGEIFVQAMDGLNCLLQCVDTRGTIIEKLGGNFPNSNMPRIVRILDVDDPAHLTAALRMMLTLSRISEATARRVCSLAKTRLRELTRTHGRIIGPLSAEILLILHKPNVYEKGQVNLRDPQIRENIAGALVRMDFGEHPSKEGPREHEELSLRYIFALDTAELNEEKKILIRELQKTVQKGNARGRTAATMTLLKLCEAVVVRDHIRKDNLLDVFVDQLQHKDTALLAAYALATCLKYSDIKASMKHNELLPKYIVGMLQEDFFDDAVGQVEGFQIFGNFMQHDDLRRKIKNYNITKVLEGKLGKGAAKEIRTSLVYLDIFRTFDEGGTWVVELVEKGLKHLRNPEWKIQKTGVTILSSLALTEYGVAAIQPRITEIIEMLLPESYLPIHPTWQTTATTTDLTDIQTPDVPPRPPRPPSWMMGPACVLQHLAQNQTLRDDIRNTIQYSSLNHLYLSATLVQEKDTSPWRVKTPDRTDVIDMLDKVIKAVDEELLSEEGLMSIGDALPPHIQHWDRLGSLLRSKAMVVLLPALLGVPAVAILAVVAPLYLSVQAYESIRRLLARYRNKRALDRLCCSETEYEVEIDTQKGVDAASGHEGDGRSDINILHTGYHR